ncbi:hypothetical protein TIFTF001_012506 [Ficus carica]|uniref:Uncharacterized protein n=1 Tax=Ficus carica TaxID=3494 RepID=A0AA88A0G5_FICCA|nr:hypothetical protein TIFTF001_012506 [Ficus carica]
MHAPRHRNALPDLLALLQVLGIDLRTLSAYSVRVLGVVKKPAISQSPRNLPIDSYIDELQHFTGNLIRGCASSDHLPRSWPCASHTQCSRFALMPLCHGVNREAGPGPVWLAHYKGQSYSHQVNYHILSTGFALPSARQGPRHIGHSPFLFLIM